MKVLGAIVFVMAMASAAGAQAPPDAAAAPAPAQPAATSFWDTLKFGATLEGYYQYNWNRPPDRSMALRAYDTRSNTFSIQQTALVFDVPPAPDEGRRYTMRVDLQFGQATETVQGGAANEPRPDVYRHVWQAYGGYVFPVGRGLRVDLGKFGSTLGFETNYAKDNQAFSRAYLFNFLPFYHNGLRTSLPVNDKLTLTYMLTNGIQQTEDFNDYKSNHLMAVVTPTSKVSWTINYYFGQEQGDGGEPDGPDGFFRVFDTYVAYAPTSKVSLALDVNYVTNEVNSGDPSLSLQGIGAYARYQATPRTAFGVRVERLDDEGLFGGIDQVLNEVTLTAEVKPADAFILRAEYRRDGSSERFFPGPSAGDLRDHQNTFLVGMIWFVGNKTGAW